MHLCKTLTLLALTSSTALSFKINAFSGPNCTGNVKEINSFRVLSYGAGRRRAGFYSQHSCVPSGPFVDYFADGGSDKFKKRACLNLGFEAHAFGSRSARWGFCIDVYETG
ncbi:hypothetical protein BJX76DRAFT_350688 [Aspergillus varians]